MSSPVALGSITSAADTTGVGGTIGEARDATVGSYEAGL